jgi:RNA polymerase sigma-70 factor (ECF subfamily)
MGVMIEDIHTKTTDNKQTDEELFERIQGNDQQAFAILYERYNRRLYSYCLRMLSSPQKAEDVFHDVIMKMYHNKDSFHGGSFGKWIFTIARTSCLNAIRNEKYTVDVTAMEEYFLVENDSRNPMDTELLHRSLHKAISDLPQEFREVLVLKQFNDFAYADIAEMLDISVSLAKVRVFRAIKMLQKQLSPLIQDLNDE